MLVLTRERERGRQSDDQVKIRTELLRVSQEDKAQEVQLADGVYQSGNRLVANQYYRIAACFSG